MGSKKVNDVKWRDSWAFIGVVGEASKAVEKHNTRFSKGETKVEKTL